MISVIVRHSQTPYRETLQLHIPPLRLPAIDKSELPGELSDIVEKMADITLQENAERGELSRLITDLLIANFDAVNAARDRASQEAGGRYFRAMAAAPSGNP